MKLNTYFGKQQWKFALFVVAVIIGIGSMWYTSELVKRLSHEERKKISLWAEAQSKLVTDTVGNLDFYLKNVQGNETIPVIVTDSKGNVLYFRNLDEQKVKEKNYLHQQIEIMKTTHEPIEIFLFDNEKHYIYYKESNLLSELFYYPIVQLGVIFLFIIVSYLVFSTSRQAEQNQVWVGLAKETAHQLGTPISSLVAWIEILKLRNSDIALIDEAEKDVKRLETITERFSKIGSPPTLLSVYIAEILYRTIDYLKKRTSSRVIYTLHFEENFDLTIPLNVALFEWVIENLCKNAVDAMNGAGSIDIYIIDTPKNVYIDVQDSGKGIPKSKQKTIFQPGYTTKKRGWGLGLSLAKRIVETYHKGKIFVKESEIDGGTTFRIAFKKD